MWSIWPTAGRRNGDRREGVVQCSTIRSELEPATDSSTWPLETADHQAVTGRGNPGVPVQVRQQLVAVEPADDRHDALHLRIGERGMQISDPRLDRRRVEVVAFVDMVSERESKTEVSEAGLDQLAVVVLQHQSPAPRRCDDS